MLTELEFLRNAAESPWILLAGISITRIYPDLLHILDLALAPDAAASAAWLQIVAHGCRESFASYPLVLGFGLEGLLELTSDRRVWPGASQETRLSEAYADFASMCKAENVRI